MLNFFGKETEEVRVKISRFFFCFQYMVVFCRFTLFWFSSCCLRVFIASVCCSDDLCMFLPCERCLNCLPCLPLS